MAVDRAHRSPVWRWPLRAAAVLLVLMLWTQPLLIGLFLAGDFDKLAAHALVGGLLVALTMVQFPTAVLAWRPGGLPGWVVGVAGGMTVGAVVQIAAGYQRNLGVHIPLGVTLAAAGAALAIRAWWPTRPDRQRRDRTKPADLPSDHPLHDHQQHDQTQQPAGQLYPRSGDRR